MRPGPQFATLVAMRTWTLLVLAALANTACISPDIALGKSGSPGAPAASRFAALGEASRREEAERDPTTGRVRAATKAEVASAQEHGATGTPER